MDYNTLKTGEPYTLSSLFSKDNKVIIPDLQRDYCWGTEKDGIVLARDFVENIIYNGFEKKADLSLGLLYGYETPKGHIQLCDGQQRITTLYLLLGLINKKSENKFRDQLISKYEFEEDDKEPYLQYSIRESSLYFLSDLVCNFFLNQDQKSVNDINKQLWYFRDYDYDPSIISMINALVVIEEILTKVDISKFVDLGLYLTRELSFLYYDMGTRANGEETFVIINTTGEPLSLTENLKPIYLNVQSDHDACSEKWEKWETWFWKHRKGQGQQKNDTAENGFKEFFRWIAIINSPNKEEQLKILEKGHFKFNIEIPIEVIDEYFDIVRYLFEESKLLKNNLDWLAPDATDKYMNNYITWFRLLPIIEYVKRFGRDDPRNLIRVKQYYKNLSRIDNISKYAKELIFDAITNVKILNSNDIAEIVNVIDNTTVLLSIEERTKFNIFLAHSELRQQIENIFWKTEEFKIFNGEIYPMIQWSFSNGKFDFETFLKYNNIFFELFHNTIDYEELDLTRRALLTLDLNGYPRMFRGNTNMSFCWEYSDWKKLIFDNIDKFGSFLNELVNSNTIKEGLDTLITSNSPEKKWDEFVKIPELLKFCMYKNIQYDDKFGWLLVQGVKTSGAYANLKTYRLFLDLKSSGFGQFDNWILDFYPYEGSCAFYDNKQLNVAIDIKYLDKERIGITVFRRKLDYEIVQNDLQKMADVNNLKWNGARFESKPQSRKEFENLILNIQSFDFRF